MISFEYMIVGSHGNYLRWWCAKKVIEKGVSIVCRNQDEQLLSFPSHMKCDREGCLPYEMVQTL